MPLYDYLCDDCGDFRAFRPISEREAAVECPRCGEPAERMLTAPSLGSDSSGWLTRTAAARNGGAGGWRRACGVGCTHAGGC